MVDDSTFWKWLVGIIMTAYLFLLKWTHSRASSAHTKIDNERKDNEARFNLVYEKIAGQGQTISKCKNQIEEDMKHHMREDQIKDFVDRSIKPLETQISTVHDGQKAAHEDIREILKELQKK